MGEVPVPMFFVFSVFSVFCLCCFYGVWGYFLVFMCFYSNTRSRQHGHFLESLWDLLIHFIIQVA